ncbi:MAG: glycyl-radical enzyme activating protein [Clostridiales bacterium]|nr:glycyl-radical enzyme activating protein [Clostridiales bacterium]
MGAENAVTQPLGIITNIQRFSLHDGPGVRSTVFFKGCPLRCLWCHNPETYTFQPALSQDALRCTACGGCVAACPQGALKLTEYGLQYNVSLCIRCFACAGECPTGALSVLGREVTAGDVLGEVLPDKGMYERTGGGVTLSGGEAAAQPKFALALIDALHQHGIRAALDTCGYAESETFLRLCREADLILFDLKHIDNAAHKRLTGKDMTLIKRNFFLLSREQIPVQVRVPVIPGLNDDDQTLSGIAELITKNPKVDSIVLLGYHPLGGAKAAGLDEERPALSVTPPSKKRLADLARTMAARTGLSCTFR